MASIEEVHALLKKIIDPELGVNIIDLGLVYKIEFTPQETIQVDMTLTSKGCPMGEAIMSGVSTILSEHFPDYRIQVNLVWDPRWTPEMISEEGLALL